MRSSVLGSMCAAALLLPSVTAAQTPATLTPPENLVVEGLPPIPASLPAEVRRYTESRAAQFLDWHPTRREMLIATRFGNTNQIHVVKAPLGARTQLTFFDEPVNTATWDPVAGRYFVFARDVGGNEFAQLYLYDMADGQVTLLTDGGRSQNGAVVWSTAGDRIAYASTRRNGADRDIWVMRPDEPSTDRLVLQVSGGGWFPLDWSPDDRRLLVVEFVSITQSRY